MPARPVLEPPLPDRLHFPRLTPSQRRWLATGLLALSLVLCRPPGARAQTIDGPPPPVAPAVITRGADGKATLRAVKVTDGFTFDGRLDDAVYKNTPALTGFTQTIPDTGKPSSQKTEAWIFFDRRYIYVACRCYDARPQSEWTANEMRRDQLGQQDNFGFMLDTYYDRRNGYMFYTNVLGAQADVQVTNEGNTNADFNPLWEVKTSRFEGGWMAEMRVPFTSLRYKPGTSQIWGVQMRRTIRARNEWAFLTPLPAAIQTQGLVRISTAATLVGVEVPSGGRNLEVKPYAISTRTTDRVAAPPVSGHLGTEAGLDVKYGVTQNLTADFTVNTDVAAAEADDQQINLTRFNLSLTEKRDFFLEGRGIFTFGNGSGPSIFYSRQIGLNRGRTVPIIAGARLTGKVGRTTIGLLNIETGQETVTHAVDTNFTVARVRQDILRRSSVGAMVTSRSSSLVRAGEGSAVAGVDAAFGFYKNLSIDGSYARANTPGRRPLENYVLAFALDPDRWGVTATHIYVDKGFNPEVGFVNRDDIQQTVLTARFSPRPEHVPHVERFNWTNTLTNTPNTAGRLESRTLTTGFSTELENSDVVSVGASYDFDRLLAPFTITKGITLRPGSYTFNTVRASYSPAPSRPVSGTIAFDYGGYYGGTDSTASYSGRVSLSKAFQLQPSVNIHWIRLPVGNFTSQIWRSRVIYTFTPEMFLSALVQYNTATHTLGTNVRLRWEYSKGSELFVVYNENQNAAPVRAGFADLLDRSVAVKVTKLFRF